MRNSNGHIIKHVTVFAECRADMLDLSKKIEDSGFRGCEGDLAFDFLGVEVDVVPILKRAVRGFDVLVRD